MNNVFNCYFFLSWNFSGLHKQYYNLSLGGTHQFYAKRKQFCYLWLFSYSPLAEFFLLPTGVVFPLGPATGCILSSASSHRCWERTGASLRQHCSRYLAAVTADYPLNSPLSANRKSSIISFLHSRLSFRGYISLLDSASNFQHSICSDAPLSALVSAAVLPSAALRSEPQLSALRIPSCWSFSAVPAFLCYWERDAWQLVLLSGHQKPRMV